MEKTEFADTSNMLVENNFLTSLLKEAVESVHFRFRLHAIFCLGEEA